MFRTFQCSHWHRTCLVCALQPRHTVEKNDLVYSPLKGMSTNALRVPAATKKTTWRPIWDSKLFDILMDSCLIPKYSAARMAKLFAGMALVTALLAWWLVPTYLVVPLGAKDAKIVAETLLALAALLTYNVIDGATKCMLAHSSEERVMKRGKAAFGDDFAAAVRAFREEVYNPR
jgi:hypothetical protein